MLAMRRDAVAANAVLGFCGVEGEAERLLDRPGEEPAHAVRPPTRGVHHLGDGGSLGSVEKRENAFLLGDALVHRRGVGRLDVECLGVRCFGIERLSVGRRGVGYLGV